MKTIDRMFAYITDDTDDTEGVVGIRVDDGWLPMVGADEERVRALRPYALTMVKKTQHQVRLVVFTRRVVLEVFEPTEDVA